MTDTMEAELTAALEGAMMLVTLDRPKSLNALTAAMRARLAAAFVAAARDPNAYCVVIRSTHPKAFSAGSDVREVLALAAESTAKARQCFGDEYALNWHCECFSKPTVPLIDGMVMGGGVGISLYGTHRVAGENYRFAMPETKIGLFPDVGVCHALARMPGHVGMYLGLTGAAIGRADAYALGLVTHCIPGARFAEIRAELADVQPVDTVLDTRHEEPEAGALPWHAETIDRCFGRATVEEIVAALEDVPGPERDWAAATAAELRSRSPIALKITHRHILSSSARDLKQVLEADYRLACRALDDHDFREGVRAVVLDKDNAPRWRPARLEDVTEAMVDAYFAPLFAEELNLPTRAEMQAARI